MMSIVQAARDLASRAGAGGYQGVFDQLRRENEYEPCDGGISDEVFALAWFAVEVMQKNHPTLFEKYQNPFVGGGMAAHSSAIARQRGGFVKPDVAEGLSVDSDTAELRVFQALSVDLAPECLHHVVSILVRRELARRAK
jgi:hypothetical protein